MHLFFAMLVAYLIGSIPMGYLLSKYFMKIDIREYGSKSMGATNVLRVVGKLPALLTLLFDIGKGIFIVSSGARFLYSYRMPIEFYPFVLLLGLCVVVGHIWPIFLDFRGGKGVATSAGMLFALSPQLFMIGAGVWVLIVSVTRIVSIASILSSLAIVCASYYYNYPGELRVFLILIWCLIFFKHRSNIQRLTERSEHRISLKRKR